MDVYSAGVLLGQLLFEKDEQYILTYGDEHPEEYGDRLERELAFIKMEHPDKWGKAHTLLVKMIEKKVWKRITLEGAMADPYFQPINDSFRKQYQEDHNTDIKGIEKDQSETSAGNEAVDEKWTTHIDDNHPTKKAAELRYIKVIYEGGCGIRIKPEYPGEFAGVGIKHGEVVAYSDKITVNFNKHAINFYELSDGRGWIHNYNPKSDVKALQEYV